MPALRHIEECESSSSPHFWRHREVAAPAAPDSYDVYADPRELNEEELKRLSKECLVSIARNEALPNRSKMNKAQLARTLRKHFRRAAK